MGENGHRGRFAGLSPRVRGNRRPARRHPPEEGLSPRTGEPWCPPSEWRGRSSPRVRGNRQLSAVAMRSMAYGGTREWLNEPRSTVRGNRYALSRDTHAVYPRAYGGTRITSPTTRNTRGLSPRVRGNPLLTVILQPPPRGASPVTRRQHAADLAPPRGAIAASAALCRHKPAFMSRPRRSGDRQRPGPFCYARSSRSNGCYGYCRPTPVLTGCKSASRMPCARARVQGRFNVARHRCIDALCARAGPRAGPAGDIPACWRLLGRRREHAGHRGGLLQLHAAGDKGTYIRECPRAKMRGLPRSPWPRCAACLYHLPVSNEAGWRQRCIEGRNSSSSAGRELWSSAL